jgi:hypothetical protein
VAAAAPGARKFSQGGLTRERRRARKTNGAIADGKAVWSWHPLLVSSRRRCCEPNRARKTVNPPMTVTRRIRRRGERGISRKTIVQGMPECSVCTCMLVCAFLCTALHTRPRVQQAPGIPCALFFYGRNDLQTPGENAPRECGDVSATAVIARLDRATQYSRGSSDQPIGRGVLDTRMRGYDG